ncbi:hypothetical protein F4777DRAFT_53750 [Nemania sp. FL0916]|nr:hypothetical protein F4777DRAFT_53750 [Nemania sp. FL0916]
MKLSKSHSFLFGSPSDEECLDDGSRKLIGDYSTESGPRDDARFKISIQHVYILILHLVVFALVIKQWNITSTAEYSPLAREITWSPIQQFIEYETRTAKDENHGDHKKFGGSPGDEQDEAWDYLINGAFFNATFEELSRAGESLDNLAELSDGGYMASIGVYHELHCVRQLRLYIYRERYYPNITEEENFYLRNHLDHCLESLRETIMCNGNTAVSSFYWPTPDSRNPAVHSNAQAVCAKWDSIERWAYSRKISVDPDFIMPHNDNQGRR